MTRFKCPGCPKTYTSTAGIINHLQTATHPAVEGPITQEATRVNCQQIDGHFVVVSDIPRTHKPVTARSWTAAMGFDQTLSSVSAACDGDWIVKTKPLTCLDETAAPSASSTIWKLSKRWVPSVSAFLTDVNRRIPNASVSEQALLSSDKCFVVVQSAPANYSKNIALLLQFEHPDQEDVSVASVIANVSAILEDPNPARKKTSRIVRFCSAILKGLPEFRNPNTFQFCMTHVKHALKGAALIHFQENRASAKLDEAYARNYLSSSACTMIDLQHWKRAARRCIPQDKEEILRWTTDPGVVQVCTDKESGTWFDLSYADYARFVHTEVLESRKLMQEMGAGRLAPEDLKNIKDPPTVAVGHGMMTLNNEVEVDDVVLPLTAAQVLQNCYNIGNKLGKGIVYSGAGAMRIPQLACIAVVRINESADRTLRLFQTQTAVRYSTIKQADLIPIEQQHKFKKVLKFQYEELSAAICDYIINCKPLQVKAAIELYGIGSPQARAAGSLLIVGPNCLPRVTRHELDSLTQIVNASLARFVILPTPPPSPNPAIPIKP